jgi:hypothetical protein
LIMLTPCEDNRKPMLDRDLRVVKHRAL